MDSCQQCHWLFLLSLKLFGPNCSTDHKCHIILPLSCSLSPSLSPSVPLYWNWLCVCVHVCVCGIDQMFVVLFIIWLHISLSAWNTTANVSLSPSVSLSPVTSARTRFRRFRGKLSEESQVSRTCKHNYSLSILQLSFSHILFSCTSIFSFLFSMFLCPIFTIISHRSLSHLLLQFILMLPLNLTDQLVIRLVQKHAV